MRRFLYSFAMAGAVIAAAAGLAHGQAKYPTNTLTIVVPFNPGGGPDIIARKFAEQLRVDLGIPVIVENKQGASGQVGALYVAKARNDGSVVMLTATHHVVNPAITKSLPYDSVKDFTPIVRIASNYSVLAVSTQSGIKTLADFIALAKKEPGKLKFASNGVGGLNRLAGEMLKVQAGIDIEHVPYDSVPAGLAAVMGGHIASVFAAVPGAQPYIQEGRVVGLAVTGPKRVDTLPDVPTMKESGLPDFEAVSWYALYGPAGLPAETRTLLENAFKKLLAENESRTFLEANGMIPDYLAGKELEDYVVTEIGKWGEVAAAAHIERE